MIRLREVIKECSRIPNRGPEVARKALRREQRISDKLCGSMVDHKGEHSDCVLVTKPVAGAEQDSAQSTSRQKVREGMTQKVQRGIQ